MTASPAIRPGQPAHEPPADVSSLGEIRSRFPALARMHNGRPVAYFDGPGGTQVPVDVTNAMSNYLLHHNANTAWAYPTSEETDAMLAAARQAAADFLNAKLSEVAFGNNMTTLTFHLSRALGAGWGPGDEVVITDLDHHANVAPWRRLEKEHGITIRRVNVHLTGEQSGQLDWASLERAIGKKTRLLAIGAGSNALGTITDVARAGRLAHAAGALVFVDAVHYAPHALVDVRAMDCDFLGCSPYKFYGPHIGVLYGRESLVAALDVPKLDPAPDWPSERLEVGTQNHEGIIGTGAAVDFLASLQKAAPATAARRPENVSRRERLETAFGALHSRGQELVERLWTGLAAIPGVTMHGPTPEKPRTPTVAFTFRGQPSIEVARHLATRAVFVSHGDFYASTIIELLGHAADGVVRAGCACYTSADEVDRLVTAVTELA
ncbi:MAG TPA: cysteine desulfurase-like protein [Gemmatimonadaceae bacterium]|nr:cysteine desulfurase-like protein [Gemmatimonadaceae bacterium]